MNRKLRFIGWVLFVVILLSGTVASANSGLITSFSPAGLGESVANNVTFRVVFAEPMVSQEEIDRVLPVEEFPFNVMPQIQAEGRWLDQSTFSASLLAPLDMATLYSASTREGLRTLGGRIVSTEIFSFRTAAPALESARATATGDGRRNRREINVRLDFNMPVFPSRLRGFLTISDSAGRQLEYRLSGGVSASVNATVTAGDFQDGELNVRIAAGFTGNTGNLAMEQDETKRLSVESVLNITGLRADRNGNIIGYTSFNIDLDSAASFISVEPNVPFTLQRWFDGAFFIRGNFNPRERFVFTFRRGLPSSQRGLVLEEEHTQAVIMPDLEPSIRFVSQGMYLSPIGGGRIPVELVNLNRLNLNLWRLHENNIPYVMRGRFSRFQRDLARRVLSREFDLSLPLNERVRRSISLEGLLNRNNDDSPIDRGLFLLTLSNPDDRWWNEASQVVNLSDMGVVVRLWEDGLLVWVNTLSGLEPVEGAHVRLYSHANQLLAEGGTGRDGIWHLQRSEIWEQREDLAPHFVTVSKGHDVTFVQLTHGLLSREVFDTSGRPWLTSGYDAVVFSARGIYRTGENAPFKAVVRAFDLSTPPPFPVLFVVRDPLGRTVRRSTVLLSEEGGALFDFDIPGSALTGTWTCSLFIPGDENNPIGTTSFQVEDFAPPRIEVSLSTDIEKITPDSENVFDVSAMYLFGVEGAGLKWEASWRAREGLFRPRNPRWASYTFRDETRSFTAATGEITSDRHLSGYGRDRLLFLAPNEWRNTILDVTITARVMEDGGRWVSDSLTLPYFPSRFVLGLAAPEGELAVGRELTFRIASLTPNEEPVSIDLDAGLYRVTWNHNLVTVDGHTRWQSSEEMIRVETKNLTTEDGSGSVTFRPERWGTYIVRVSDRENNASASIRFNAFSVGHADRGSQLIDRVEIEADKESYNVGDVAQITLRAPFEGLLLFNVEAFGLLDRRIIKIEGPETVIEVPITEQMIPNAWAAAWLIRPVVEDGAWSTHRAAGIKRINVDTSASRLNVRLDAPENTEPATRLPVTLTLTDRQGQPVRGEIALALVDDGVLGLTGFRTPDLLGHFLAPRRMNSNGFDIYDQLMPLESRHTELLHPAGGSLMEAFAAASGGHRFNILSIFEGMISTDGNGIAKIELDLPEFSGRGRIFAVAYSGNRYGMAERTIQIARDIIVEADLPRFAAPGDVFTVPVTVFNSSGDARDVSIELSVTEELSFDGFEGNGRNVMTATIAANSSHRFDVTISALSTGVAVYTVKASWNENGEEKSFEQEIELPIRSPYPVVTISGSGFFESGETAINVDKSLFTDNVSGRLLLADTPLVNITSAVTFLANFPHGGLEHVVSTAWPFLVLPEAISQIDPLLINSDAVRMKTETALVRIQSMQLYDGSFARWQGNTHSTAWGSVHATHFLVEARRAGVEFPEEMLRGALNWLRQFLASIPGGDVTELRMRDDFTTKAYAVYVLVLNGERPLGWIHHLRENQQYMWPSGRIWLAGAEALLAGQAAPLRALGAFEWGRTPEAARETLESDVRNAAQLLSIWTEIEPRSIEAIGLVQMLLDSGRQNNWFGTQENSAVAMALGRFMLRAGYEQGELEGILSCPEGEEILSFRSGESSEKHSIGVEALPSSSLVLRVTGTGTGYYVWNVMGSPISAPEPGSSGLRVDSLWLDANGVQLDLEHITHGTRVFVTLTIDPALPVRDVALSYLLPAGMEIENPQLINDGDELDLSGVRYDIRDDRLIIFIDNLNWATEYRFSMRAVTRGTFVVPPLAAEAMYNSGVYFIGEAGGRVVIE